MKAPQPRVIERQALSAPAAGLYNWPASAILESNVRFTSVELKNWRNFSAASATLQKRLFLVGPNASGKSNFLDVFRFLHDIVAVGGGFKEAIGKRGGVSSLRCYAARGYPDISVAVTIGTESVGVTPFGIPFVS